MNKKLLFVAVPIIALCSTLGINAHTWDKDDGGWGEGMMHERMGEHALKHIFVHKMAKLIEYLQDKSIEVPPHLLHKAIKLKSKMAWLAAKEFKGVGEQMKSEETREKYFRVAHALKHLSGLLEDLPTPHHAIKRSFKHIKEAKHLEAKKLFLKAHVLHVIAEQIDNEELSDFLRHVAHFNLKMAHKIKLAVEKASRHGECPHHEMLHHEGWGHEDMDHEGMHEGWDHEGTMPHGDYSSFEE